MFHRYVLVPLMCVFMALLMQVPASANVTGGDKAAQHCVISLETGKSTCYSSFADSISAVSRGKVTGVAAPNELTDAVVNRISAAAPAVVTGILYQNNNWTGSTLTFTGTRACSTGPAVDFQSNIAAHFNDRTSSYLGFSSCRVQIFEETNWTGSTHGPQTSAAALGAMNDQASSVRFS